MDFHTSATPLDSKEKSTNYAPHRLLCLNHVTDKISHYFAIPDTGRDYHELKVYNRSTIKKLYERVKLAKRLTCQIVHVYNLYQTRSKWSCHFLTDPSPQFFLVISLPLPVLRHSTIHFKHWYFYNKLIIISFWYSPNQVSLIDLLAVSIFP